MVFYYKELLANCVRQNPKLF